MIPDPGRASSRPAIVRSITFNVADWLFGPVPFLEGLRNVARDSWNALVQLGIDEWNFFLPPLPPLPPLPLAAKQPANATAQAAQPEASAPAAGSGRGSTGRTARAVPVAVNSPAAAPIPRLNRHPKSDSASLRQTTPKRSPSKGVGRAKPR